MKARVFALFFWLAACPAMAQSVGDLYVSAGVAAHKTDFGGINAATAGLGYRLGPVELGGGLYGSRQAAGRQTVETSGRYFSALGRYRITQEYSLFAGCQWSDLPSDRTGQRWGFGGSLHAGPALVSLVHSPRQREFEGAPPTASTGIVVSFQHSIWK